MQHYVKIQLIKKKVVPHGIQEMSKVYKTKSREDTHKLYLVNLFPKRTWFNTSDIIIYLYMNSSVSG